MENIKKNNAKITSGRGYYETICDLEVLVKDIDAIMGEGYAAIEIISCFKLLLL